MPPKKSRIEKSDDAKNSENFDANLRDDNHMYPINPNLINTDNKLDNISRQLNDQKEEITNRQEFINAYEANQSSNRNATTADNLNRISSLLEQQEINRNLNLQPVRETESSLYSVYDNAMTNLGENINYRPSNYIQNLRNRPPSPQPIDNLSRDATNSNSLDANLSREIQEMNDNDINANLPTKDESDIMAKNRKDFYDNKRKERYELMDKDNKLNDKINLSNSFVKNIGEFSDYLEKKLEKSKKYRLSKADKTRLKEIYSSSIFGFDTIGNLQLGKTALEKINNNRIEIEKELARINKKQADSKAEREDDKKMRLAPSGGGGKSNMSDLRKIDENNTVPDAKTQRV